MGNSIPLFAVSSDGPAQHRPADCDDFILERLQAGDVCCQGAQLLFVGRQLLIVVCELPADLGQESETVLIAKCHDVPIYLFCCH